MKIELGHFGRGQRKGSGLLGEIEQVLDQHELRLNLTQQARLQWTLAIPIVLKALGFEEIKGEWQKDDGVLLEGELVDTLPNRDKDIERHEERLLKLEAVLARLEERCTPDPRTGELAVRVTELEKSLTPKPPRRRNPVKE